MEGMPYVVIPGHLSLKGTMYSEARQIATRVTLIVAEELHSNGVDEIVIADSHGPMVNLLTDNLPDYVELVRGYPRPTSMLSGIEGCDAALFLGYHGKAGTMKSSFDHTYSSLSIGRLEINRIEASEFLLNAYSAGDLRVPVIFLAGDYQLIEDDVKKYAPWVETVPLKRSLNRGAARSFGMGRIERELRAGVKKALTNLREQKAKPLVAERPVKMKVTFQSTYFADAAELLPMIKRTDGLNVEFTASNMTEAYKVFEFLCLASMGVDAIKKDQA
jgi:D-amino peptidase